MNFVYMSPNFPDVMRNFCKCLKDNGVNVLGIGDCPYNDLHKDLKESLTEYYRVNNMEDYDQVLRAVGYFTGKYGKIDWLESNNEYWLNQDAKLRTDFNITTGLKSHEMDVYKRKSCMKEVFEKAGLRAARWHLTSTVEAALEFAAEVGYPMIVKPDSGVGASHTWKIKNEDDLRAFFDKGLTEQFIMEEFVPGEVTTFDGIINSRGEVLFAASHVSPTSIMDMVNEGNDCFYYVNKEVPADIRKAGEKVLAALGAKSRCFHLEFFRLTKAKKGLGRKGQVLALEINMRPAGGFTPDMINFAASASSYQIYADMVTYDEMRHQYDGPHSYCVYYGRRDGKNYVHNDQEVQEKYGSALRMTGRMADALSDAMGNQMYIACLDTEEALNEFISFICAVE